MSKGVNFHPQLIEDALNNCVPCELKGFVKSYHLTKWKKSKPKFVGQNYYQSNILIL